jgi:hypothetical protein
MDGEGMSELAEQMKALRKRMWDERRISLPEAEIFDAVILALERPAIPLPELKALHERLGEVLWDVSAGRIKVEDK